MARQGGKLDCMRFMQDAIYWPEQKNKKDQYGKPLLGAPITVKVRWEDKQEKITDAKGEEIICRAVVWMELKQEVDDEGYILLNEKWDGSRVYAQEANYPADPTCLDWAYKIRARAKVPNITGTYTLYKVWI